MYCTYIEKFKFILSSVANRHTSNEDDEPVCLATLFDLDPTAVLEASNGKRMAVLLMLMRYVPASIIFIRGPRICVAGFGWAPRSFMVEPIQSFSDPEIVFRLYLDFVQQLYPQFRLQSSLSAC